MDSPILLIIDSDYRANPFGRYLSEILRTEGFAAHQLAELTEIHLSFLRRFPLVVLAEVRLEAGRRELFRQYVSAGGRLVALRPDPELADLFGLKYRGPRAERLLQYLAVDPSNEIGRGIESLSLQYHGEADEYEPAGASVVAWLNDSESAPSPHPAVAIQRHGEGLAIAFTYDLARSVALMRQGNPDWACGPDRCEDGDGFEGIRPVDGFMRRSGELWVDPARIPVPQADEQQRLLANCLMALSEGLMPLPRLWYLPEGRKAALVMTGDGDKVGFDAFDRVMRVTEEYGGHFTAYLLGLEGDPTRDQVEEWIARGHEVALHVDDTAEALRPTLAGLDSVYARGMERFLSLYGRPPGPSMRHHWLIWYGWAEAAEVALRHGVKVDFDFYHGRQWKLPDGRWVQGYYTGSGLPQRFVKEDGDVLDLFQVLTEWADETQLFRQKLGAEGATHVVREMMDAAEKGRYSVFVANFHPSVWEAWEAEAWARNMMQEAVKRGIPIWSGEELSRFLAAREAARFSDHSWDGTQLGFALENPEACSGLTLMLPARFGERPLARITRNGETLGFTGETVAGREYAFVQAVPGKQRFDATYGA